MPGPTIEQWIIDCQHDEDKDGDLTMMSCVHLVGAGLERELHTIRFGAKKWTARDLADVFMRKAKHHCAELVGVQQFMLLAFYGGRNEPEARRPFRVQGEADLLGQANSEGPNATGMASQAMRHLEAMGQMYVRSNAILFDAQNETIKTLADQLNKSRNENIMMFDALKATLMEQATNMHVMRMEEIKAQQSADDRKSIMRLLPAIANRVTGKQIVPESLEDSALVEAMVSHIDKNPQLGQAALGFLSKLPPELSGMFASRMEQILRAKKDQNEKDAAIVHSSNGIDPDGVAHGHHN